MRDADYPLSIWVALPTYNGALHLREQLNSILCQTRLPNGLVACDDDSADATKEILHNFAETASFPVIILEQPSNVGLLSNLETALSEVLDRADAIAFADQDDVWHPEKLDAVDKAFGDPNTLLWFSDAELTDSEGHSHGVRLWDAITLDVRTSLNDPQHLTRFILGETITGTAMAARSSLIEASLPFPRTRDCAGDLHFLHDGWLGLVAHLKSGIVTDPRPMTHYRQHDQQYTGMSLLHAARVEKQPRRRSLDIRISIEEDQRLRSVVEHLHRAKTLAFLGGCIPEQLARRVRYSAIRTGVLKREQSPFRLFGLCEWYTQFGDGWKTLFADLLRYALGSVRRTRALCDRSSANLVRL